MKRRELLSALGAFGGMDEPREYVTSCRFCNVGCGFQVRVGSDLKSATPDLDIVRLPNGNHVQLVPDPQCPVNEGNYSVRGAFLAQSLYTAHGPTADRLQYPMVRSGKRLVRASWDEALDRVAERLRGYLAQHGPQSIGFYHADWFGGENAYAYMKLAKILGVTNYDTNGRLCAATGAAGLMRSLGGPAHPWSYEDIEHADVIVLAGANAFATLSVIYDRIFGRVQSGGARLIVMDVSRTLPAQNAEQYGMFLQVRPGTDVALYNALGHVLIADELLKRDFVEAHTNGFAAYRDLVMARYAPEQVTEITGVPAAQIREAARSIGKAKAALFLSGKGLEHQAHGTDMICALINVALLVGSLGRPGASYSPLGGHQGSIINPPLFAGQLDHVTIPNRTIFEMLDHIEGGTQKALICAAVNPLVTLPDGQRARRILGQSLEFLVVTDIYPTETSQIADVVFPAASWGETPFTSTNSERRVRFYEAFAPAPSGARPDWEIPAGLGKRLGHASEFPWKTTEDIFEEMKAGQPFAGLSYARLKASGSTNYQLPVPAGTSSGTPRLYTDGHFPTPDNRARLWALEYQPHPEPPSSEYPFVLITGRENDLWQSGYTFKRTPELVARLPHNELAIHPRDAARLGIATGKKVRVRTRRGTLEVTARLTEDLQPGTLFSLWGYPGSWINALTINARDPISQEPSYKSCAAGVESVH